MHHSHLREGRTRERSLRGERGCERCARARGTQGVGRGKRSLRGLARRRPTGLEWRVRGKDALACVGLKVLSRSTHKPQSERVGFLQVERALSAIARFSFGSFVFSLPQEWVRNHQTHFHHHTFSWSRLARGHRFVTSEIWGTLVSE